MIKNRMEIYENGKSEVLNSLKELKKKIERKKDYFNEDLNPIKDLDKIINKIDKTHFRFGVVGTMKNGKSTMVNSVLGEDIVSCGDLPTTATLTQILYDKENKNAKVKFIQESDYNDLKFLSENKERNIQNEKIKYLIKNYDNPDDKVKLKRELEQFEKEHPDFRNDINTEKEISLEEIKEYSKSSKFFIIDRVDVSYQLDILKNNVILVDTPGLNDSVLMRSLITEKELLGNNFDAIIMVLKSNIGTISKVERNLIKNLIKSGDIEKIFFVINLFSDESDEEKEALKNLLNNTLDDIIEDIIEDIEEELESEDSNLKKEQNKNKIEYFSQIIEQSKEYIFTINLLKGFSSKKMNDMKGVKESGLKEFEEGLTTYFGKKIYEDNIKYIKFNIENNIENITKIISKKDNREDITKEIEKLEKIKNNKQNLKNKLDKISKRLEEAKDEIINDIKKNFEKKYDNEIKLNDYANTFGNIKLEDQFLIAIKIHKMFSEIFSYYVKVLFAFYNDLNIDLNLDVDLNLNLNNNILHNIIGNFPKCKIFPENNKINNIKYSIENKVLNKYYSYVEEKLNNFYKNEIEPRIELICDKHNKSLYSVDNDIEAKKKELQDVKSQDIIKYHQFSDIIKDIDVMKQELSRLEKEILQDIKLDDIIKKQTEKDSLDEEQSDLIKKLKEKLIKKDSLDDEQSKSIEELKEQLKEQAKSIEELKEELKEQAKSIEELKEQLKINKKEIL